MATRIKDWIIPYTWGIGIEITNNHVINVLLRELNNLIHVNGNRELYVDLQLDDWIQPSDDFPVGVTTGRILQEDWWQQSWLILNWKTTSWDYGRFIIADDWNLYVDLGDWIWRLLGWGDSVDCNVRRFIVRDLQDSETWQAIVDWVEQWKYAIIVYGWASYIQEAEPVSTQIRFYDIHTTQVHWMNNWTSRVTRNVLYVGWENWEFSRFLFDTISITPTMVWVWMNYTNAFNPTQDGDPATKKYIDDWLALKQDILTAGNNIQINGNTISATDTTYTAWTRITIQNGVISADLNWVFVYKWNVTSVADLSNIQNPSVWDTYFVEWADMMYAWDGTNWNAVWSSGIDLTNYFNKVNDNSDDITEWSTNLFVTSQEKSDWNSKQEQIIAWQNITIDADWKTINAIDTTYTAWNGIEIDVNNVISATPYAEWDGIDITGRVISNTAKFDPENTGSLGQFLKKTSTWYAWANVPWWGGWETYTAWDGINIDSNNVISNTKQFDPTNNARVWYVLKASGVNSYYRAPESWGGGGWWWVTSVNWQTWAVIVNEVPDGWNTGQVLTKNSSGYWWSNIALWNVRCWGINSVTFDNTMLAEIWEWISWWINNRWAILRDSATKDAFIYIWTSTSWSVIKLLFRGENRYSRKTSTLAGWNYTKWWCNDIEISIDISGWAWNYQYSATIKETDNEDIKTNYISVTGSTYSQAFEPVEDWQPATKLYVDRVASGSVTTPAITNNMTWTTSIITQEWVGTQAQYNALVSNNQISPTVIYNIIS